MLKKILLGIAIAFVIAQFFRPALTNPAVDETRTVQAHIAMPRRFRFAGALVQRLPLAQNRLALV